MRAFSAVRWLLIHMHLAVGCLAKALATNSQRGRLTPLTTERGYRRMRSHICLTARQSVTMRHQGLSSSRLLATAAASPATKPPEDRVYTISVQIGAYFRVYTRSWGGSGLTRSSGQVSISDLPNMCNNSGC